MKETDEIKVQGGVADQFLCVSLAGPWCLDIWSNPTLDISVRVLLNEICI